MWRSSPENYLLHLFFKMLCKQNIPNLVNKNSTTRLKSEKQNTVKIFHTNIAQNTVRNVRTKHTSKQR